MHTWGPQPAVHTLSTPALLLLHPLTTNRSHPLATLGSMDPGKRPAQAPDKGSGSGGGGGRKVGKGVAGERLKGTL